MTAISDVPSAAAAVESAPASAWPSWQRVLFRFVLCYALLYTLPGPLSTLFSTVDRGLGFVAAQFDVPALRQGPWLWAGVAAQAMDGGVTSFWQGIALWLHQNGLSPVEVIVQDTGSGDTGAEYVRLGCIVLLAILITAAWTFFARARAYPRLGRALHLWSRWYLGICIMGYGFHKVYGGQFGTPSPMRLTQEVGDMSPMGMVWTFMAASRPYELFSAWAEVLGGVLLLHRRTALLGCLVTIGVLLNVCALNWLYDVPVKLFSTNLLLFAVALLAPFRQRLWALLVSNGNAAPVDLRVTKLRWLGATIAVFGWLFAVGHLAQTHLAGMRRLARQEEQLAKRPQLYGVWTIEAQSFDGQEVPADDATRWRSLTVLDGGRAILREVSGRQQAIGVNENLAAAQLLVKGPDGKEETFSVELGIKKVQQPNSAPRTMAEFSQQVEVDRRSLVLRGKWGDRNLELRAVERVFRLHRGFHWVQELPFNR